MIQESRSEKKFKELFATQPLMVRSPARINIAGEHMDYNLGSSMAAAIDKEIHFAIGKNDSDSIVKIVALDYNETLEFDLNNLKPIANHWSNYITGVVNEIIRLNKSISGFNCVFGGNIPQGAGISSSAAVTSGIAFALNELFGLQIEKTELAKLCMNAEHKFANVKCGLLDPLTVLFGKMNNAIVLNFKTLAHSYIDLDLGNYTFLLLNSNVSHNLSESGHLNKRFESCYRGAEAIQQNNPAVMSLCDATMDELINVRDQLSTIDFSRCKYIIEESSRFAKAKECLANKNIIAYGNLMFQTHEGMSKLYEISCFELEVLIAYAKQNPYIIGARMMGGGFGGCTINLVLKNKVDEIKQEVAKHYLEKTKTSLTIIDVNFAEGVSLI
jgi:galactokinase